MERSPKGRGGDDAPPTNWNGPSRSALDKPRCPSVLERAIVLVELELSVPASDKVVTRVTGFQQRTDLREHPHWENRLRHEADCGQSEHDVAPQPLSSDCRQGADKD